MPGNPLPEAEALVSVLLEKMRPAIGPETGLVGIHTGGVWLAERIHRALKIAVPLGTLDVSFYRDDYEAKGLKRKLRTSIIPFEVEGRHIVLVDDVLYTGRTIRAALNELFDYGRPASIRLAALVDRGGRELPVCASFSGATIEVSSDRTVILDRDAAGKLELKLAEEKP